MSLVTIYFDQNNLRSDDLALKNQSTRTFFFVILAGFASNYWQKFQIK